MIDRPIRGCTVIAILIALLVAATPTLVVWAQAEEPSPIEVQIVAPQQAGPGQIIDVVIDYDAVDLNAGAILNFNLSGPGHVWKRMPEPPNPVVNTWGPTFEPAQGKITVQVRIDEGTDGQKLRYEVEIKWAHKWRKYVSETDIKFVPPTPTPTPRPRPQPQPTQAPPTPVSPTVNLTGARFVSTESGQEPITAAEASQTIGLDVQYSSSGDLQNATLVLRLEPDYVEMEGMERVDSSYRLDIPNLPAAPGGASLPGAPFRGRVRPYADGGPEYSLMAFVELQVPQDTTSNVPGSVEVSPLEVSQRTLVTIRAEVESEVVKSGGSLIVHAVSENLGEATVSNLILQVHGLPPSFVVQPDNQVVDQLPVDGGVRERLFTIRAPLDEEGQFSFKVVGTLDEGVTAIESEPIGVQVASPVPLALRVAADRSAVRAGGSVYFDVTGTNEGQFVASNVTARLIDTEGNLGVLLQEVGDIGPGESREMVFVVTIPEDFPADVESALVVQTISEDGTISESPPIALAVACVPSFELIVQPPVGKLRDGEAAEAVVVVRNTSQCKARDVSLVVHGLPETFTVPPEGMIAELSPGESRHVAFSMQIPDRHPPGEVPFTVIARESLGTVTQSLPAALSVRGVSALFTIVFGVLTVLAIAAIVYGLASFLRQATR